MSEAVRRTEQGPPATIPSARDRVFEGACHPRTKARGLCSPGAPEISLPRAGPPHPLCPGRTPFVDEPRPARGPGRSSSATKPRADHPRRDPVKNQCTPLGRASFHAEKYTLSPKQKAKSSVMGLGRKGRGQAARQKAKGQSGPRCAQGRAFRADAGLRDPFS